MRREGCKRENNKKKEIEGKEDWIRRNKNSD